MNQEKGIGIIRIGLGLVLLWFGISQLTNPAFWTAWLPAWASPAIPFIIVNGVVDSLLGLALILGLFVKPVGLITFVHLAGIAFTVGYGDIGVRDAGLALVALGIAFTNGGDWRLKK